MATSDYGYDARGRLATLVHSQSSTFANYAWTYDSADRVKAETYAFLGGTYTYEYDAEGNRIRRYIVGTNVETLYEWDHRNRLTTITDKDVSGTTTRIVHYTYDAMDRRIGKAIDELGDQTIDHVERYVYDGDQIVLR